MRRAWMLLVLTLACKRSGGTISSDPQTTEVGALPKTWTTTEMAAPITGAVATREVEVLFAEALVDDRPYYMDHAVLWIRDDARWVLARVVRVNPPADWHVSRVADRKGYRPVAQYDHPPTLDETRAFLAGCDWLEHMIVAKVTFTTDRGFRKLYGDASPEEQKADGAP